VVVDEEGVRLVGEVPAGFLYVDGVVGDVNHGVLRDRRVLAEEGVIVVIVTVDMKSGEVIAGPEIITRGWIHAAEAEDLLEDARRRVVSGIEDADTSDVEAIKRHARKALASFVSDRTKRRPMIVPVVMEA
jgi:ribonuclease J